jgi:hypothetical protein
VEPSAWRAFQEVAKTPVFPDGTGIAEGEGMKLSFLGSRLSVAVVGAALAVGCSAESPADGAPVAAQEGIAATATHACSPSELAVCNCPNGFYCCPNDGGCFLPFSDVQHTKCRDTPAVACAMNGAATSGAKAPPAEAPSQPSPPPPASTTLPTRLRITSQCAEPIWIAHSDNVPSAQNVRLVRGQSLDVPIPDGGLASARFWPKTGCDASGHACVTGDTGEGGGKPCSPKGCAPPVDSKFEATFAPRGSAAGTWYNLSQVDGYTLPFKVMPRGKGAENGSCVTSDCAGLSLDACPTSEDMSGGGRAPFGRQDLRVRDAAGKVVACMAPCKKWNYPAPWGLGQPESADPGLHMCCPTPIDPTKGNCSAATSCMTSQACSDPKDPLSVVHTDYVSALRRMCPSAYSYAYDDQAGLHTCSSEAAFEVVFCP